METYEFQVEIIALGIRIEFKVIVVTLLNVLKQLVVLF